MIVLQGAEDEVVPPAQAEIMVDALEAKGLPYAYLLFEGEQHGFRKAETIIAAARGGAVVLRADPGVRARRSDPDARDREPVTPRSRDERDRWPRTGPPSRPNLGMTMSNEPEGTEGS